MVPNSGPATVPIPAPFWLPYNWYNFNDQLLFFSATAAGFGNELWATAGSADSTYLVKDIRPGDEPSNPRDFVTYAGQIYFSADDGVHGRELWRTDGTSSGTFMVKDLNPGLASSDPNGLTVFQNHLYFSANDGIRGTELWRFPADSISTTQLPVAASGIHIYPNPAAQFLNLQFDRAGAWDVLVYNVLGVLTDQFQVPGPGQNQINIGHLPTGLYSLICTNQLSHDRLFAKVQIVRE